MSLEAEAFKSGEPRASAARRPPSTWDHVVRFVATVLLLGILSVVYWIPMELMGGLAPAAIVLAALTMLGAGVASRLYRLRVRVDALEAALHERDHATKDQTVPPPHAMATAAPLSEEVKQQS